MTSPDRRPARWFIPVAAATALGAGAGAAVYAAIDDGSGTSSKAAAPAIGAASSARASAVALTSTSESIGQIYKAASPAVVDIVVKGVSSSSSSSQGNGQSDPNGQGWPFGGGSQGQQQTSGEGSGFLVDGKGDIVTNDHVVSGASSITVRFASGATSSATLVGADASSDLAVIRVASVPSGVTPLQFDDSSTVAPGDGVVAIGSPFGLQGTVTSGIVSAIGRTIDAPNGYAISGAIQTDAAINHGNSGGPLLDAAGKVIGVNAQIESDSGGNDGVGFAIPSSLVQKTADALISGKAPAHALLGVQVSDATSGGGAAIGTVRSGSPAEKGGLKSGDVVTAIDGAAVKDADALTAAIGSRAPGDVVHLSVRRGTGTVTVTVTLGTRAS